MPEAETALLLDAYGAARVILEFGSGASTALAAQMPGKYIQSVESDRVWARKLRAQLAAEAPKSPAIVYHVDIGATGRWGRPIDDTGWQHYPDYPNRIWDQPFFRHPDVILIDGRFRTACLMSAMLRITRPIKVLFDDYTDRATYHLVEQLVQPVQIVGRMAEFHLSPGMVHPEDVSFVIAKFFERTLSDKGMIQYELPSEPGNAPALRRKDQPTDIQPSGAAKTAPQSAPQSAPPQPSAAPPSSLASAPASPSAPSPSLPPNAAGSAKPSPS